MFKINRYLRFYSTPTESLKLWVKLNENQPIKVPTKGCVDIDDFSKNVKKKLNTKWQVAIYTCLEKEPINSWLSLNELLKTEFIRNSGESPLFVKIIPITQDSINEKTIYIGETDDYGEFTDEYITVSVQNNEHLRILYRNSLGLINLSNPSELLVDFDQVKDGEKYQEYRYPLLMMAKEGDP